MKHRLLATFVAAAALAGTAFATTGTTTTTTGTATTTSNIGTAIAALNFSTTCATSGTRVSTGSWDATSGALALSTTETACVGANGETHDGSRSLSGTLLLTGSGYSIDVTAQEDFTVTRDSATTLKHTCTSTRKGSFDSSSDLFTGTITRSNCSDSGALWDHQHILESLLRDSQVIDVPPAPAGMTPPAMGQGGKRR